MLTNGRRTMLAPLLVSCALTARSAVVTTYGGAAREPGVIAAPRPDGGTMLAGSTDSFGAGGRDGLVIALDARGVVEWSRSYGTTGDDEILGIVPWADGWLVSGATPVAGPGSRLVGWLGWLDRSGVLIAQQALDPAGLDLFSPLQAAALPDGGAVLAGSVIRSGDYDYDAWVVRLLPDRSIAWQRRIGGPQSEFAQHVTTSLDGAPLIGGAAPSLDRTRFAGWILELGMDGLTRAEHGAYTTAGNHGDVGMRVAPGSDGGVVLVGYDNEEDGGSTWIDDAWAVELDTSREIAWGTHLSNGTQHGTVGSALRETPDGGWLVGGTVTFDNVTSDGFLARLDPAGDVTWQRGIGGAADDDVTDVLPAPLSGGWTLYGRTASYGAGDQDWLSVALDSGGGAATPCDALRTGPLTPAHEAWQVETLASPNVAFTSSPVVATLVSSPAPVATASRCEPPHFRRALRPEPAPGARRGEWGPWVPGPRGGQ